MSKTQNCPLPLCNNKLCVVQFLFIFDLKSKVDTKNMASAMDVDDEEVEMASSSSGKGDKKRFEVKKVHFDCALSFFWRLHFFVMYRFINYIINDIFYCSGMLSLCGPGVCVIFTTRKYPLHVCSIY